MHVLEPVIRKLHRRFFVRQDTELRRQALYPPIWGHSWGQALLKNPFAIHFLGMDQARLRSIGAQASTSPGIGSRKPQRITITVSWSLYQSLLETSDHQGRSLSNTAAYWLERQCERLERKAA
jgi:hypothetical protein